MKICTLCPRMCAVDRKSGERGICGQTTEIKVARAALHFWEEPCISGEMGSGAVFFSGCALHCVFCQNENIANGTAGKVISTERLGEIFLELQEKGANNINLVTPGQFVPQIIKAVELARNQNLKIPIVYNTSSYESYFSLHSFHTPSIAIITMELYEIFENASTSNSLIVKFRNKTLLRRLPLLDKTIFNPYIDCKINNLIIFPIRDLTV